ncbi:hypothetical protein LPJ66_002147 [Kickxella alabastrina]|uniref:Uncharacterized protein n=1 Tax=Kickxella alabastrina TaxID=61397 RepID=A0ACC1IR83_9FUNG|nr:hypothetical protein LPJ66_002147 [Kickxella alabastrina]
MYYHAGCAEKETDKEIITTFDNGTSDYENADMLPNEADINTMDVAELRQAMLTLVRLRKTASPKSAAAIPDSLADFHIHSPILSYAPSSIASASPPPASTSVLETPKPAGRNDAASDAEDNMQPRKRYCCDSDVSVSQQRMGIDLLLNASTLSDHMDCQKLPVMHSPAQQTLSPTPIANSWPGACKLPALPPISQFERGCGNELAGRQSSSPALSPISAHPLSSPVEGSFGVGSFGASSLEAYRIGGYSNNSSARRQSTHHGATTNSLLPLMSAARSQPGTTHRLSPPESHCNISTGATPSQELHCSPSQTNALLSPSNTMAAMIFTPNGTEDNSPHRQQHYQTLRTTSSSYTHSQQLASPAYTFGQSPSQGPSSAHHDIYSQAHGYFMHQQNQHQHQHSSQAHPHAHSSQHTAAMHAGAPGGISPVAAMPAARNVSKPKFNYAFLDTKRPRGPSARWSVEEDILLKRAVKQYGEDRQWVKVAQQVPGRTNLQCRQRWLCNIKAQVDKEYKAPK